MKLLGKWKRGVSLFLVVMLLVISMKEVCCTAQVSKGKEQIILSPSYMILTCSTSSISIKTVLTASEMPTKAEVYRAKIKSNGKNGEFKKIGNCKDFFNEYSDEPARWTFVYKDQTVKSGAAYVYKYKVYCDTKDCFSKVIKGMAAKTIGEYTCKIVKSTAKKLVVKLTGSSKKNGLLKLYHSVVDYPHYPTELRYKNNGEEENRRYLKLVKYSYDGKKWYKKDSFSIKGKQSVYLHFETGLYESAKSIKVLNYQYVQMILYPVEYNLYVSRDNRDRQIRFNLSSGTAAVSNFISSTGTEEAFVWDGEIFEREYEGRDD